MSGKTSATWVTRSEYRGSGRQLDFQAPSLEEIMRLAEKQKAGKTRDFIVPRRAHEADLQKWPLQLKVGSNDWENLKHNLSTL